MLRDVASARSMLPLMKKMGGNTLCGADIRSASREHMERSFQQRRQGIVGDCRQLTSDVDSYNQNHNIGEDIQLVLDFTLDIEEYEALKAIA
jgi:hypothetical protein